MQSPPPASPASHLLPPSALLRATKLALSRDRIRITMPSTVNSASLDQNLELAKQCSRGFKAAAVATVASAVPTLVSVRMLPWAKANINPAGQALIVSTVAGMAYFIAADKKILSLARQHSYENAPEHLKDTSFQGTGRPHPGFFRP
uniref:Early nodulin-93 n=1 Tax=Zea mays TaxID=4577 RepID=A0A804PSR4_MAIZE